MRWLKNPLLWCVLGVGLVHKTHVVTDRSRFSENRQEERFFLPSAEATNALSLGQQTMVSDFFWIRTILIFSDFAWNCQEREATWLLSMIRTMSHLDPKWRTLYFYGGTMMGVCNQTAAADEIFLLGHENLPGDYFFPFSLAMNAYLEHRDFEKARYWMEIASNQKGAPGWYRAAVAGVISDNGQRSAAIEYLRQELDKDLEPSVRSSTEERLRLLQHDDAVDLLTDRRHQWESQSETPLMDLELLAPLPVDPWGEGWILSPDGEIRSVEMDRRAARKSRNEERRQVGPSKQKVVQ